MKLSFITLLLHYIYIDTPKYKNKEIPDMIILDVEVETKNSIDKYLSEDKGIKLLTIPKIGYKLVVKTT